MRLDELKKSLEDFKAMLEKKHTENRNKYYGDNIPAHKKSKQEQAAAEEKRNQDKLKQKSVGIQKSDYGKIKGQGSQYNLVDNIKRTARNVEEGTDIAGPNKNPKQYTTPGSAMGDQQRKTTEREQRKAMAQGNVKVLHPETKEMVEVSVRKARAMARAAKKNKEAAKVVSENTEKCDFDKNGQWKMSKMDVFSGAGGNIGAGGMPMGAANKSDKIPGGLAAGKTPKDFDAKALAEGTKAEMEHTSDKDTATEIAMDHLTEDPQYYKKLKTIEKHQ